MVGSAIVMADRLARSRNMAEQTTARMKYGLRSWSRAVNSFLVIVGEGQSVIFLIELRYARSSV